MATGRQRNSAESDADQSDQAQDTSPTDAEVAQAQADLNEARDQLAEAQQAKQDADREHETQLATLQAQLDRANQQATLAARQAAIGEPVEPKADYDAETDGYVVLTSAVTLKYGKENTANRRYVRGMKVVRNEHNGEQIDRLVQLRALAPNDGVPKAATTARVAALAAGAQQDTVARTPIVAHLPQALPDERQAAQAQQSADEAQASEDEAQQTNSEAV
jgi:hypothetical protein